MSNTWFFIIICLNIAIFAGIVDRVIMKSTTSKLEVRIIELERDIEDG